MRPILVIEQQASLAGLGLLGVRLRERGLPFVGLRAWEDDLHGLRARDFSGIVPLGGAMHAWNEDEHRFLLDESRLLAEAVDEGVPVLGVCLGAQLLARTLGAEVHAGEVSEIGWLDIVPTSNTAGDPLLGHLAGPVGVYQWHHDVFDLPAGAVRLASSSLVANQAFRAGTAWGVQFHPEVDAGLFDDWLAWNPGACEQAGIDEAEFRHAVARGTADSQAFTSALFDAFGEQAVAASRA